ncbi:MAG: type III-B CRISPR module RAMP protein Cmr1 [Magnetococcales bacterium]|nr:type III-B CRISPR module RAMP protein Cmr1 [Magnetococcales bacterium]
MVTRLKLSFEILSPMFLGGAEGKAELRPPSIKGALRFWYRAVDPDFNKILTPTVRRQGRDHTIRFTREHRFMGGAGEGAGQAPFLLSVAPKPTPDTHWEWETETIRKRFNKGQGRETRNGLVYLGYPFVMKGNENRTALAASTRFDLRCIIPRPMDSSWRQAFLASWWLLGHLGGLGSRNHRGFGSLVLREWQVEEGEFSELAELPLLANCRDEAQWRREFDATLERFRQWLGPAKSDTHQPHLGQRFRIGPFLGAYQPHLWDQALADCGLKLQTFRLRRKPDYERVKEQLIALNKNTGQNMDRSPDRACFGLPLTFRFTSLPGMRQNEVMFLPFDEPGKTTLERHGSLLHLRLTRLGQKIHPFFLRLDGDVPGETPPAAIRFQGRPLHPPATNAMDDFMNALATG